MSSERIRVDDLPPFNAAEHLDSVPAVTAYLTDTLRADSPELLNAATRDVARTLHEREGLRGLDVEAVARAIEADAGAPLPELRQALAEFDATRARLHTQRSAARRRTVLLNTPEEDAAINAGIEADPDTLEVTDAMAAQMQPFRRAASLVGYPARLEAQPEGSYTVTFRDVPEAITQGDTRSEAMLNAADALASAMSFYAEDGRPRPEPSPLQPGEALMMPKHGDHD